MKPILAALVLVLGISTHSTACAWPSTAPLKSQPAQPTQAPAPPGVTFKTPPAAAPAPETGPIVRGRPCPPGPVCVQAMRFSTRVTPESVAEVAKFLQQAHKNHVDLVLLELDTGGGEYESGHDMSRFIEVSPVPVVCVVDGRAASMGFYIFQSCDRRLITPRSLLMAHSVSIEFRNKEVSLNEAQLVALLTRVQSLNRAYAGQMAMKLKLTAPEYLAHIVEGKEWWMTAEEALKVGAVDAIWKGNPNQLYQALRAGNKP